MVKKQDLRIRKTKATIYRSILQILKNKSFEQISVTDICKASNINRSTFYDHFNDKQELIQSFINDMGEELTEQLPVKKKTYTKKEYYLAIMKQLLEHMEKKKETYSFLFTINDSMIYEMLENRILNHLQQHNNNNSNYLIDYFYISGAIRLCMEFMKKKEMIDYDTIIKYLDHLIPEIENLEENL